MRSYPLHQSPIFSPRSTTAIYEAQQGGNGAISFADTGAAVLPCIHKTKMDYRVACEIVWGVAGR